MSYSSVHLWQDPCSVFVLDMSTTWFLWFKEKLFQ